jgi:allophanate hydrolase
MTASRDWLGRTELHLEGLGAAYRSGAITPAALVDELAPALEASDRLAIWIHRTSLDDLRRAALALERGAARGPLWGVPFAVKDNIDVAGVPTTAACPSYGYVPASSAAVVERLIAAGALLVGKTNLDQFATGLVGVRSPHGAPPNPFGAAYVPGGSSSGSAAAVARGLVSFALGTDTAGSGRVPAALSNTVGLKPSPGVLSTRGVVPACRSLDCVSIHALTVGDAARVAGIAAGHDRADPFSRPGADRVSWRDEPAPAAFRFGVPADGPLGDRETDAAFARAVAGLERLGGTSVAVDFAPLSAAARLLYDGPWVAERLCGLERFITEAPGSVLPVIRDILLGAAGLRATQAFAGLHELARCRREAEAMWASADVLVVPTVPDVPTLAEVAAQPIAANARLGRYTNFVNLLDLAALAVPNGFRGDGLSTGITLIGPWGHDARIAALGAAFHRAAGGALGATPWRLPASTAAPRREPSADELAIAVVGAHLSGQPLNHQLTARRARLLGAARTAPSYRLHALAGAAPARPGLVRVGAGGAPIELEVWAMPRAEVGAFLAVIPPPLCLGAIELDTGERVTGFLCEAHALAGARDITQHGGWRAYLRSVDA